MPENRAQLRLEIQLDEQPISGELIRSDGERAAFAGWVGLVSLIERSLVAETGDEPVVERTGTVKVNLPGRKP